MGQCPAERHQLLRLHRDRAPPRQPVRRTAAHRRRGRPGAAGCRHAFRQPRCRQPRHARAVSVLRCQHRLGVAQSRDARPARARVRLRESRPAASRVPRRHAGPSLQHPFGLDRRRHQRNRLRAGTQHGRRRFPVASDASGRHDGLHRRHHAAGYGLRLPRACREHRRTVRLVVDRRACAPRRLPSLGHCLGCRRLGLLFLMGPQLGS